MIFARYTFEVMPCPSADTIFVLSILNFLKYTQTESQSVFGMLKSEILLHKLAHLSILKKIEYMY